MSAARRIKLTADVIGAGLAGVEAAWQLANAGVEVTLKEMKPVKFSPAHKYEGFAELVCSNSLKAADISSACGLLKEEMRYLNSVTMAAAERTKVDAGGALAVDRKLFSDEVTRLIKAHPLIKIESGEVSAFPDKNTIIATGPLTSDAFAKAIRDRCGDTLSFYDAAAPIVTFDSVDMDKAFFAARYDKGGADYINCPMDFDEYESFYSELINASSAPLHEFDRPEESAGLKVYEGCMPVEVLAKRGRDSLRYGCMKPVGLTDPRTGRRPYAAVQLRKENNEGTMYNLVGFQTNLRFAEQKRVFSMIPGLENAEFVRYGVMHRNTFLNSPMLLDMTYRLKDSDNIYFAGQMTGVEGYVESAASGIIAGINLANRLLCEKEFIPPEGTMLYALSKHVSSENKNFQPMGASMGLLPKSELKIKDKRQRYTALAEHSLERLREAISEIKLPALRKDGEV